MRRKLFNTFSDCYIQECREEGVVKSKLSKVAPPRRQQQQQQQHQQPLVDTN